MLLNQSVISNIIHIPSSCLPHTSFISNRCTKLDFTLLHILATYCTYLNTSFVLLLYLFSYMPCILIVPTVPISTRNLHFNCTYLNTSLYFNFNLNNFSNTIHQLTAIKSRCMYFLSISGFHRAFLKSITFTGRLMHSIV